MEKTSDNIVLPDELIVNVLNNVDSVANHISSNLQLDDLKITKYREKLLKNQSIQSVHMAESNQLFSMMAVDGAFVRDKLTATDLLIAVATGIEGFIEVEKSHELSGNDYLSWVDCLSHGDLNHRLAQGIMHLMEMKILSQSKQNIALMDGSHLTFVVVLNSLLQVKNMPKQYSDSLLRFLRKNFAPSRLSTSLACTINEVLRSPKIISLTKYSSSQDYLKGVLEVDSENNLDDKSFFSMILKEGEYTSPVSVGQSSEEAHSQWGDHLDIKCNLNIDNKELLNNALKEIIDSLKVTPHKSSKIYYTYFKPVEPLAYRLEIKEDLALNESQLQTVLRSIKKQIAFPYMIEPIPCYVADKMSKHVSMIFDAFKTALKNSPSLQIDKKFLHLLDDHRS